MKIYNLSMIIPTRNEEEIIRQNVGAINSYLENCPIISNYEMLLCDYSTDNTSKIIKELEVHNPHIKYIQVKKRGIGAGILAGLEHSTREYLMLYPIDISWDFDCIEDSLKGLQTHDVVLASREHPNSIVKRTKKRIIFSKIYNTIVKYTFNLKINDTQCTFAAKREDIIKFLGKLSSDSAFLQTQILIHAKKSGLKMKEIPTSVTDTRSDSKINILRDGTQMLKEIISEKLRR